jgi:hypothetical protein
VVDLAKQLEILLPPTKKRTFPAEFKVTEIVVATPLLTLPETVGALIEALSLALVIVTVRVCVSESAPSETVMTTTYVLFVSPSAGASKSGAVAKVSTPLEELIAKSAASVPDMENESEEPASTSVAA